MRSKTCNNSNYCTCPACVGNVGSKGSYEPMYLNDADLMLELDRASISAANYKLNRILLYITDTAIVAIVILLIYLTAVGSLPLLILLPTIAALALTSFTNHITSQ